MDRKGDEVKIRREEHVREIKNWLQLSFLTDRVNAQLQQLLLSKLEKLYGRKWDGSSEAISLLQKTLGRARRNAPRTVRERIDNGDVVNWDLQAVSYVLHALSQVFPEEKQHVEVAVGARNFLAHLPNKNVSEEEFSEKWNALLGVLNFLKAPTDLIQKEIKAQTANISSLYSPSILNREANKLKEEGNDAFKDANYDKAVEKFEEAMKINTLRDSERGVLFSNRSAAFLQLAKTTYDDDLRKCYARRAKNDAKRAVHLQPLWSKALFRLAVACEPLEKYDNALAAYNEALTLDPNSEAIKMHRDECRNKLARRQASDHLPPMKTYLPAIDQINTPLAKITVTEQGQEKMDKYRKTMDELGKTDVYKGIKHRDGLETPVNYELAVKYFSKATANGNAQAAYELATLTQQGKGVLKAKELSILIYKQAAEMAPDLPNGTANVGVREAMHALGFLHRKSDEAFEWYKRAADLDYGPSANNLGDLYNNGEGGVPHADPEKAVEYWKIAAQKECTRAMRSLAYHYRQQRNFKQARDWMELAIKSRDVLAMAEQEEFEAECAQEEKLSKEAVVQSEEGYPSREDEVVENVTKALSESHISKYVEAPEVVGSSSLGTPKTQMEPKPTMDKRVDEIKNWLHLSYLCERVNAELQKLLLSKLEKICGCEWDGSPERVSLLKQTLGEKELKFAGKAIGERIDKGDVCNWDLTSVSFVLRSLSQDWVSSDERQHMEAAVEVRNYLSHHQDRIIPINEFSDKRDVLHSVLTFLKAPVDLIEKETRNQTADVGALYSPSVLSKEAQRLKDEGNTAFRNANYDKAVEKYDEAIGIITLKDSERSVLFANRSATFLQLAATATDAEEREQYAKQAETDAKRAVHLHPLWPKAHQRLGDAYQALEKYQEAVEVYNEALGLDPSSKVVKVRRDDCRNNLGKRERKEHLDPSNMVPTSKEELVERLNRNRKNKHFTTQALDRMIDIVKTDYYDGLVSVFEGMKHRDGLGTPVNYELAAKCFSEAAAKGNAQATYELALAKKDGRGVRRNHKLAIELLQKAASMTPDLPNGAVNVGVRDAMHVIGLLYDEGVCVDRNEQKAFEWFKRAADLGYGASANNLALMYKSGRGLLPCADPEKAVQYWKLAARDKNTPAMQSLAEHFLVKGDVQQARRWMKWAIEEGDVRAMAKQEAFEEACSRREEEMRPLKDMLESELGRPLRETDSIPDLIKALSNNMHPVLEDFKNQMDSVFYRSVAVSPHTVRDVLKYNPDVVAKYAAEGRVYAQQVLEALQHFFSAWSFLKSYEVSRGEFEADELIRELSQCLEIAAFVSLFTDEQEELIKALVKQKMGMFMNTLCPLDICARKCYAYLIMSSYEENVAFLKMCIAKYPNVLYFHDALASMYGFLEQYTQGVEVAEKALAIFPDNCELLYTKAALARLAYDKTKGGPDQEIENYNKFLQNAPKDHRKVPEAYFCIAQLIMLRERDQARPDDIEETQIYYQKGLESEQQLMPCFLPYKSTTKDSVKLILELPQNLQRSEYLPKERTLSLDAIAAAQNNLPKSRLTDPCRVIAILEHRHYLKNCADRSHPHRILSTTQPQFEQTGPPTLAGLKAITLWEMNPAVDKEYKNCVLDAVLIEDPTMNLPSVHVLLEDTKGDVLRGFFYNVEGDPRLKYGAKISIANPYLRIGALDNKPGIRVDDPKSLFFHDEDGTDRCRYCGTRNSRFRCCKCKRKYCSKECQTHDWKLLKHNLICGLQLVKLPPTEILIL